MGDRSYFSSEPEALIYGSNLSLIIDRVYLGHFPR
jgi:hypothetical protein